MSLSHKSLIVALFLSCSSSAEVLTNATAIEISQAWSQQPDGWTYPLAVSVPESPVPEGGFPLCILLHGNGGSGDPMLNQFRSILPDHALVAPTGYQNSWNICAESSDAPDWEMIRMLVGRLHEYENINPNRLQILGVSNGAALVNTAFVMDPPLPIEAFVAVVSHFNEAQYHQDSFHQAPDETDPAADWCGYSSPVTPATGRRYLSMSNVNDGLIPYEGGPSPVGVTFLSATDAIYKVAQSQGFLGKPLSGAQPQVPGEPIWEYIYLDGQVTHLRGLAQHGMSPGHEQYARNFLNRDPIQNCAGDEDGDGEVNFGDLTMVLASWGASVGINELLQVLSNWGPCL
jgi:poly(3-hydroxybutyrate) depolymerase